MDTRSFESTASRSPSPGSEYSWTYSPSGILSRTPSQGSRTPIDFLSGSPTTPHLSTKLPPQTPVDPPPAPKDPPRQPRRPRYRTPTRSRSRSRSRHTRSRSRRHHRSPSWSTYSRSSIRDYSPTLSTSPQDRVSPVDDITTFNEVLVRGAAKLNIPMPTPPASTSVIFETLKHRQSSRPLLPLVPGLLEPAMELFLTPATATAIPTRLMKKYRVPDQDHMFLQADPVYHCGCCQKIVCGLSLICCAP